jgi:diaminopimelate epimerase
VTRACGSGAVAAAVAASGWGIVASPIEVLMPGGAATVEVCDDPVLIGPSVFIADIEVP